jgi:hypothetical protein
MRFLYHTQRRATVDRTRLDEWTKYLLKIYDESDLWTGRRTVNWIGGFLYTNTVEE